MTGVEVLPPSADRADWLAARRVGIGASEIAIVLGLSPWDSPFGLFWKKVNGWEIDDNLDMEAGRRLEPVIADWFADLHLDHLDVRPSGLYAHPERPWQLATPDRLCYSTHWIPGVDLLGMRDDWDGLEAVLDCKHPYNWEDFGDDGTDEIPIYYRAQLQWQMDVLCVDRGYLAAYANHQFRIYPLERDDTDLAVMRDAGWDFLQRIEAGEPPDLDDTAATLRTLKKLHPTVEDRDVEIPDELAVEYGFVRDATRKWSKALDECENKIRAALGSAKRGTHDGLPLVSRSVFEQRRIDSRRLRAEHPDLAADYTTTSTVDRLNCSVRTTP